MEPPVPNSRVKNDVELVEFETSTIVLIVGGILYSVLCGPAIVQRGFPPIDHSWTPVTFLWVSPVLLAGALDRRPLKRRLAGLTIYCLVTAFFDAASIVIVVPKQFNLAEAMIGTIVFGPIHLIIGLFLAATICFVQLISRKFPAVIFIRSENSWVGAFHEGGQLLSSASR
jgi:hypothetical protein